MHRIVHLTLAAILSTFLLGCPQSPGIELAGHQIKPEGICFSTGGLCACDGNVGPGQVSHYPSLDCSQIPFSCPVVCAGAGEFDDAGVQPSPGPYDPRVPRLVVASSGASSLAIWNNVDTLVSDVHPAENLAVPNGVTALSRSPGVLAVGLLDQGVLVFDAPRSLNAGTAPQASIAVGGGAPVRDVSRLDADLWVLMKTGGLHKLADLAHLTSASMPQQFPTPFHFDAMAFAPFIAGPALIVSDGATGRLMLHGTSDATQVDAYNKLYISPGAAHRLARSAATVFSADNMSGTVEVRRTSNLAGGARVNADEKLSTGLGSVVQLSVQHDVLIVVGTGGVGLYTQASMLVARKRPPTQPDTPSATRRSASPSMRC